MTRKKAYNPPGELLELKQQSAAFGGAEVPWWMPEDINHRAAQVAVQMMSNVDRATLEKLNDLEDTRLTKKKQMDLVSGIILGVARSPEYQFELAKWSLIKPLEFAKLQVSLLPKDIKIEAEHVIKQVIVVPDRADPDIWNDAHTTRRELGDGDWGVTLEGTPFVEFVEKGEA